MRSYSIPRCGWVRRRPGRNKRMLAEPRSDGQDDSGSSRTAKGQRCAGRAERPEARVRGRGRGWSPPSNQARCSRARQLAGDPTPSSAAVRASGFGTRSLAGLRSSTGSPRAIPRENESWPATPREGALANATVTTECLCFVLLASRLLPRYRALAGQNATASYRRLSSPQQLETCMPPPKVTSLSSDCSTGESSCQ